MRTFLVLFSFLAISACAPIQTEEKPELAIENEEGCPGYVEGNDYTSCIKETYQVYRTGKSDSE